MTTMDIPSRIAFEQDGGHLAMNVEAGYEDVKNRRIRLVFDVTHDGSFREAKSTNDPDKISQAQHIVKLLASQFDGWQEKVAATLGIQPKRIAISKMSVNENEADASASVTIQVAAEQSYEHTYCSIVRSLLSRDGVSASSQGRPFTMRTLKEIAPLGLSEAEKAVRRFEFVRQLHQNRDGVADDDGKSETRRSWNPSDNLVRRGAKKGSKNVTEITSTFDDEMIGGGSLDWGDDDTVMGMGFSLGDFEERALSTSEQAALEAMLKDGKGKTPPPSSQGPSISHGGYKSDANQANELGSNDDQEPKRTSRGK